MTMTDYERTTTRETTTEAGRGRPGRRPPAPAAAATSVRTTETAHVAPGPGGMTYASRS